MDNQANQNKSICSKCGAILPPNSAFCTSCGTPVSKQMPPQQQPKSFVFCPRCGNQVPANQPFCTKCGLKIMQGSNPAPNNMQRPASAPNNMQGPGPQQMGGQQQPKPFAFCTNCGAQMPVNQPFCTKCGQKMPQGPASASNNMQRQAPMNVPPVITKEEQDKRAYDEAIKMLGEKRFDQALQIFTKLGDYADAKAKAQECINLIENARKENIYLGAVSILSAPTPSEADLQKAIANLKSISEYKDSKAKIGDLEVKLNKIFEAKDLARKEAIYNKALSVLANEKATDVQITEAISALKSLADYNDAPNKVDEAEARLEKWKQDKAAAEEAAKKRKAAAKKRRKNIFIFAIVWLIIVAISVAGIVFVNIPYEITYDLAGGAITEENPDGYNMLTNNVTLNNPTKAGYTFAGWTESDGDTPIKDLVIRRWTRGDKTYTANWTPNIYTITLNENGSTDLDDIQVEYGSEYMLPTPEWAGHTFNGWFNGSYRFANSGVWNVTENVELTAKWDAIIYGISYNLSGGILADASPVNYITDEEVILKAPTRVGYTFTGWTYEGQTTPQLEVKIPVGSLGDKEFTANWTANTYTITLDANGGTGVNGTQTVTYDSSFTLPIPTKVGYTFDGWYLDQTKVEDGIWNKTSDITLTARWIGNKYNVTFEDVYFDTTVTYDYNYSGTTPTKVTLENGEILAYPTIPYRSGYVFTGWYTDSACTKKYDFTGTITGNMTLYAGWTEMTMSYVNSESQVDPSKFTSSSYYCSSATRYTSSSYKNHIYLVANETGTHYIYYKNSSSSSSYRYYLQIYNLTTNTTIRSNSTVSSTYYDYVSFNCNAGDIIVISLYRYNTSYNSTAYFYFSGFNGITSTATSMNTTQTVEYGSEVILPTPTKTGYSFDGWYNGDKKVESGTWNIAGDVTLTPKWSIGKYTITFDAQGGTIDSTTQTITYGSEFTLPTPTKAGHTFNGWYTASNQKVEGGTWNYTTDLTLTASWTTNQYSITFDDVCKQGEIVVTYDYNYSGVSDKTVTLYEGGTLSYESMPSRSGYIFTGWYTDSACTTKYDFTGTINQDMTLYAGWTEMTMSDVYNQYQIDPSYYNSSSYYYSLYTSGTSSTSKNHIYLIANESGTHYIYYKNSSSSSNYRYYLQIDNLTTGDSIKTNGTVGSTSYNYVSFDCDAGDIIVISSYRYSSYSSTAYFYFSGFNKVTSSAKVSDQVYTYDTDDSHIINVSYGSAVTLPTPTRVGYTFDGWYNGDTKMESGDWNYTSNMILTPSWKANTYSVTLNANGGELDSTSQNVTYGAEFTLPTPTKTGYTFNGWYDIDNVKVESETWNYATNTSLTANWIANKYNVTFEGVYVDVTITYDYNYVNSTPTTITLTKGSTLSYPNIPSRSGYVFTGWYTDSACSTKYDFTGIITGSMTLYAGWVEMTVDNVYSEYQLDPSNYSSSSNYYSISTSGTYSNSKKHLYLVANETGTHYIYYKNSSSSSSYRYYLQIYNLTTGTTIRSNSYISSTSYSYTSFDCNAGDIIVISFYRYNTSYYSTAYFYFSGFNKVTSTAVNNSSTTSIAYDSEVVLPTPTKDGYTFEGWYNGTTKVESGTWKIIGDVTLTAKWNEN